MKMTKTMTEILLEVEMKGEIQLCAVAQKRKYKAALELFHAGLILSGSPRTSQHTRTTAGGFGRTRSTKTDVSVLRTFYKKREGIEK